MKIVLLGAGAWGTAPAVAASRVVRPHAALSPAPLAQCNPPSHGVILWARDREQAQAMQIQRETGRENARYLPGIVLPPSLQLRADPAQALAALVADADLVIAPWQRAEQVPMKTQFQLEILMHLAC